MTTATNTNNNAATNVIDHKDFLIEFPTPWEAVDADDREFMNMYFGAINSVRDVLAEKAKRFADDLIADGQTTNFGRYRKVINASTTPETRALANYVGEHPACDSLIFQLELMEERRILIS